jgi:multidrug efflux pump subunit AcrA (membrane-fusion protein)
MKKMKKQFLVLVFSACFSCTQWGLAADRGSDMVILDATSVENLGVQTVVASRQTFEKTLFALGRIEVIPAHRGVVSSRIAGRIASLAAFEGDFVLKGDVVAVLESRQPGNPPPSIDLISPLDGLVSHGHASLGEPVEPDKEILEVVDLSEVYAVAQIPEDQAGLMKPKIRARISIPALPGLLVEGELLRLGTAVDSESGTIGALFVLSNPENQIRPNMRVEFSILIERREQVLSVPRKALVGDHLGQSVFVKDFDLPDTFVKSSVKIGMKNDRYVEILKGMFPGDEVVSRGAYALAFAGAGNISLKEALDAAHGHEHNEDGSEMTASDRKGSSEGGSASALNVLSGGPTLFLALFSAVMVLLVILSQWQLYRLRREGRRSHA